MSLDIIMAAKFSHAHNDGTSHIPPLKIKSMLGYLNTMMTELSKYDMPDLFK